MYLYIKATHIIFIVTWFSGMFYLVRLFIYNREALDKGIDEKSILQYQFKIMIKRLYWGICVPSAVLTFIFGSTLLFIIPNIQNWLWIKLSILSLLYLYQISLHFIMNDQMQGIFRYSSFFLRIWNELATVFLFSIVFLAIIKDSLSLFSFLPILILLIFFLYIAILIYKKIRKNNFRKIQSIIDKKLY